MANESNMETIGTIFLFALLFSPIVIAIFVEKLWVKVLGIIVFILLISLTSRTFQESLEINQYRKKIILLEHSMRNPVYIQQLRRDL